MLDIEVSDFLLDIQMVFFVMLILSSDMFI